MARKPAGTGKSKDKTATKTSKASDANGVKKPIKPSKDKDHTRAISYIKGHMTTQGPTRCSSSAGLLFSKATQSVVILTINAALAKARDMGKSEVDLSVMCSVCPPDGRNQICTAPPYIVVSNTGESGIPTSVYAEPSKMDEVEELLLSNRRSKASKSSSEEKEEGEEEKEEEEEEDKQDE